MTSWAAGDSNLLGAVTEIRYLGIHLLSKPYPGAMHILICTLGYRLQEIRNHIRKLSETVYSQKQPALGIRNWEMNKSLRSLGQ